MPKKYKFEDEAETAFLKAEIIARIRHGIAAPAAVAQLGLNWRSIGKFCKDEAFRAELEEAKASRNLKSHPFYRPEDIALLKEHLIHAMVEEHLTLKKALKASGVGWGTLAKWRRDDSSFDSAINEAQLLLTEAEADRLKDLHEEIADPKVARVASDNLRQWLSWRNSRFRDRAPAEENNQELTQILRAAVQRLIEMTPQPPAQPIDVEAAPVRQLRFASNPPPEGT